MNISQLTDEFNKLITERDEHITSAADHTSKAKKIDATIKELRAAIGGPSAARRPSVIHPNEFDSKVLDVIIENDGDMSCTQVVQKMSDIMKEIGTDEKSFKKVTAKSLKWLTEAGHAESIGKGPGTTYKSAVDTNNLVIDETAQETLNQGKNKENAKLAVRAFFNTLEPANKISGSEAVKKTMAMFPDMFTEHDFKEGSSTILASMAKEGDLETDGQRRTRSYFRGSNKFTEVFDGTATVDNTDKAPLKKNRTANG